VFSCNDIGLLEDLFEIVRCYDPCHHQGEILSESTRASQNEKSVRASKRLTIRWSWAGAAVLSTLHEFTLPIRRHARFGVRTRLLAVLTITVFRLSHGSPARDIRSWQLLLFSLGLCGGDPCPL